MPHDRTRAIDQLRRDLVQPFRTHGCRDVHQVRHLREQDGGLLVLRRLGACVSRAPHSVQNFAVGLDCAPQETQTGAVKVSPPPPTPLGSMSASCHRCSAMSVISLRYPRHEVLGPSYLVSSETVVKRLQQHFLNRTRLRGPSGAWGKRSLHSWSSPVAAARRLPEYAACPLIGRGCGWSLVAAVAGRRLASVAEITVVRAGVERLDELVGFWKLLHRHQSSVAAAVAGLDVLSESDSAVIVGKMYREWLSGPDSFAFFAEEEGRLVGYVVGFYDEPHFMWSTGRVGHIDSFYVMPELRGRGVGRLLMEAAYAEMRQAGATTVALEMVANNDVAQRFYEREGFTTTFVQMHRRLGPD